MKRERGEVERERSGITSLCELPEGEIRALGTDRAEIFYGSRGSAETTIPTTKGLIKFLNFLMRF
jgi:hypothetical protein